MYRNFFSLSELPFSISPDPKYLFMSERHKEALSHLTYGLGEVGGFALLTGEVGTGKTTISRCLMEQLPDNTQAAFILNPTLSSKELLATLCDQLKIRYRKTDASLKNLTDKISEKLIKNHENDINTLLIIDEAQHLQPEVLEQLRLLTNLETNTKKLLQVILIGQPELQQLLQRRDLRQLAQRITARYHLMPLTKAELKQYIEHRLQVADCVRSLFNNAALAKIHQLSQGIPRLINLLCHSALMQAYNQNDSVVDKRTVIAAAERALGSDIITEPKSHFNMLLVAVTASSLTAFITLSAFWWGQTQVPIIEDQTSTSSHPTEVVANSAAVVDNQLTDNSIEEKLLSKKVLITKSTSVETLPTKNTEILSVTPIVNYVSNTDTSKVIDDASIVENPLLEPVNELAQANKEVIVSGNKSSQDTKRNKDYKVTEVEGVSSDLLARFQAAIDETQQDNTQENQQETDYSIDNFNDEVLSGDIEGQSNIKPLSQMSKQLQSAIPPLNFEQHIYASDGTGWVNVNGRDRYEGDYIGEYLVVEKILPQQVILSFQGESFSLAALTNW
jgi:type II secretory pathway predicted ATPase ExeA